MKVRAAHQVLHEEVFKLHVFGHLIGGIDDAQFIHRHEVPCL